MNNQNRINKKVALKAIAVSMICCSSLVGCKGLGSSNTTRENGKSNITTSKESGAINKETGLKVVEEVKNQFSSQFTITKLEDGYKLIKTGGSTSLVIPEGKEVPKNVSKDITIVKLPIKRIVTLSTADISFIETLKSADKIVAINREPKEIELKQTKKLIEDKKIIFVGKSGSLDFEKIASVNPDFSFMLTENYSYFGKVSAKFTELGIPWTTVRLNREDDPRAKLEWIKFFAAFLGKEKEAEEIYKAQVDEIYKIEQSIKDLKDHKKIIEFRVSKKGVSVRKSGDYVNRMISIAGGVNPLSESIKGDAGTETVSFEEFYKLAQDADILIHENMNEILDTKEKMLKYSNTLKDLKAFKENNVWTTSKDYWQQTDKLGEMIKELKSINEDPSKKEDYKFYKFVK